MEKWGGLAGLLCVWGGLRLFSLLFCSWLGCRGRGSGSPVSVGGTVNWGHLGVLFRARVLRVWE